MNSVRTPFFDLLSNRIQQVGAAVCVGLDPHPAELTGGRDAIAARDFCLKLIDATSGLAAAYKPNAAFFEAYGPAGWEALQEVLRAVPEGITVILDAKRGDIASTAAAYARAAFETLDVDAVTVNPYLGADSIEPFLAYADRGVFLLCKTSNLGSGWVQDQILAQGGRVYEWIARQAAELPGRGQIGLVVGATYPDVVRAIRRIAPDTWLLAPGVGPQGGNLAEVLQAGLRADGLGLLLPVSRAISHSSNPRAEMERLVSSIGAVRRTLSTNPGPAVSQTKLRLAKDLLESGCVQFGAFTLKSGLVSPIYIDLRRLVSFPAILSRAAGEYVNLLKGIQIDCLAGLPYAALPIATAISLQMSIPQVYPRKEQKQYGTKVQVEGVWQDGQQAVVIDDLATTGGSKFEAIDKLEQAGLQVKDVVVLIDRQSGARQSLEEAGYSLQAVFTMTELLEIWQTENLISAEQLGMVQSFMEAECIVPSGR